MELSRHSSPEHNATSHEDDVTPQDMKHLTKTSNSSEVQAQLQVYMLALLLAAFIAALHAGILFWAR
jgi:hypothetical protein